MAVGNEHGDRARHYHDPLIHDNLSKVREGHGVNKPLLTEVEQRQWLRKELLTTVLVPLAINT
jgi:hypothetical protein